MVFNPDKLPPIPSVSSVAVAPAVTGLNKGGIQRFTAIVDVQNGASKGVTWAVTGQQSANTKITSDGVLTIGADETATSMSVKVTSTFNSSKSATASVRLISATSARWAGDNRIETAVRISEQVFAKDSQPQIAFFTNAWNYPDALAAAAIAGKFNAPLLLVDPKAANNQLVIKELNRLRPKRIVVLGSDASVSLDIEAYLKGNLDY
jgi:aminopeptidase N